MMKGYARVLSAFFAAAAIAVAARAQAVDQLIVKIPYEFVAAGKTLPAGTYTVRRINDRDINELSLTSFENRTGVLLSSTVVEPNSDDKQVLTFEVVGDQHILSKIETADHVFTLYVPAKSAPVLAKNQASPSTGSSSGSN
jgi:hypothetical protein